MVFEVQNVVKDPDSRYLILKGSIKGRSVTIASVYAPNDAHSNFFNKFFDTLDNYLSTHLIVGSDFNLSAHSALDRSKVVPSLPLESSQYRYQILHILFPPA